jgi:hypothetical protein
MMRARRLVWVLALAGSVGACGGAQPPVPRAATATPDPGGLRFVKPPIVTRYRDGDTVTITARLNRELRHNLGHPGEYADTPAFLDVPGAEHDYLVGMDRDPVRPTCYREGMWLDASAPPLIDGHPVEVALVLSPTVRITTTATVRELDGDERSDPARELECPSRSPGVPRTRRCQSETHALGEYSISVTSARGTSCRRALAVLRGVSRNATVRGDCYEDLCVRGAVHHGYRCRAALAGEAYWDIVCRRGKAEIRGNTAE